MKRDRCKIKKKIHRPILTVCLAGLLVMKAIPLQVVFAGDINSDEARLLQVAQETFEYEGKTYRASSGYIAKAREVLMRDDIDLTAQEVDEAIADVYNNVSTGVAEGYLYEVKPSSETNGGSTSGSGTETGDVTQGGSNQGNSSGQIGTETGTETGTDTETGTETETSTEIETSTETGTGTETGTKTETNTQTGVQTDADKDAQTDTKTETDTTTKEDTDTDAKTQAGSANDTTSNAEIDKTKHQNTEQTNEKDLPSNLEQDSQIIGGDGTSNQAGNTTQAPEASEETNAEVAVDAENTSIDQETSDLTLQTEENQASNDASKDATQDQATQNEATQNDATQNDTTDNIETVADTKQENVSLTATMITGGALLFVFVVTIIIAYRVGRSSHEKK